MKKQCNISKQRKKRTKAKQFLRREPIGRLAQKNFFFQSKPDYDVAIGEYELAGREACFPTTPLTDMTSERIQDCQSAFRIVGNISEISGCQCQSGCVRVLIRGRKIVRSLGRHYMSGKALESAAQWCAQQLKKPHEAVRYYQQAASAFRRNNNIDRAIEMLEKSGRLLESVDLAQAIDVYLEACSLYEEENRGMMAVESFKRTVGVMLKAKQVDAALQVTFRLDNILTKIAHKHLLVKNQLTSIILLLQAGDFVEAKKRFQSYGET